mgnify:CR=1 FL=1
MDIFEFELRYMAYHGFSNKFDLWWDDEIILNLVKKTNKWELTKKITQTTPSELKELTIETYTKFKKDFLEKNKEIKIWEIPFNDYVERLEYELKVIKEMGYNTYFLIVQDYINRAKKNNIVVWPWRWSAAGSILSYFIGIIDLNPIEYDLLFERFLNPARISMPDIDCDFEDVKRDQVIEYIRNKYWIEKVAYIWTYMKMAAKAAFKDVARTFGMSFEQSNKISNLITEKTIQKSIDGNEEFKNLLDNDDEVKKITELAIKLEWTIRQTWVHACGMVIAPKDITDFTPIFYPTKTGSKTRDDSRIVTQYDWHYLEDIWLLKMDFLGLRNLSIIKNTLKIIRWRLLKDNKPLPKFVEIFFESMNFYPPLDDKYTFENIFQTWDTSGVFQFESDGMKKWLIALKPTDINDLIAMVSLYRPGPMEFIPHYVERKAGKEKITYMTKELYDLLKDKYGEDTAKEEDTKLTRDLSPFMNITFGIPIYQEQLIRIVQAVAGFSLAEADMLRRWVWKKIKEVIEAIKKEFVIKWNTFKWYKEETCIYVYEKMIEPAANYSFNKSHAACYALISYQTAYLKAHFKIEFHAALLRSVEEETDKLAKFIDELKMKWLTVLPPDINESYKHTAAIADTVRIWFIAIKWVWYEVGKFIEQEREKNWEFKSFEDFLKRCKEIVNKKSIESLAKAGAFDKLADRNTVIANIKAINDWVKNQENQTQEMWLFDFGVIENKFEFKEKLTTTTLEKLLYEYEVFKTFISAHPLDGVYEYLKSKFNLISTFKDKDDFGDVEFLGFIKEFRKFKNKWTFITIEDISWEIDFYLKDVLDLKEFDIVILTGFKSKSLRIKRITKITLEDLIDKAKKSGKYNPEDTVLVVRSKRLGNYKSAEVLTDDIQFDEEGEIIESAENIVIPTDVEKNTPEELKQPEKIIFEVPNEMPKINKICDIIKNNKWDINITFGKKDYNISQTWLDEIKKIFE